MRQQIRHLHKSHLVKNWVDAFNVFLRLFGHLKFHRCIQVRLSTKDVSLQDDLLHFVQGELEVERGGEPFTRITWATECLELLDKLKLLQNFLHELANL